MYNTKSNSEITSLKLLRVSKGLSEKSIYEQTTYLLTDLEKSKQLAPECFNLLLKISVFFADIDLRPQQLRWGLLFYYLCI